MILVWPGFHNYGNGVNNVELDDDEDEGNCEGTMLNILKLNFYKLL